ncbi:hypothetical protein SAMN04487861_11637 [Selenomonas ruminantium]|uniref:Acyltransferase 3 domain-containing protein n=2 Tax=Selenomonas ruminantium TaxID=971 RepID=A0A1I3FNF1_SELRU|nr:hypothetical protein SAMN04487861_11637 [Selenomonas ruminantium]
MKLFFCFCVVGIHTHLFSEYPSLYWWINRSVFRLAVPFFMVVSIFLLEKKIDNGKERKLAILDFSKRIGMMIIVFEPIAIFMNIILWYYQGIDITHILFHCIQSVFFYPLGALWYLQAILLAVWLDFFLEYKLKLSDKFIWVIAIGLYAIGLLGNSYFFIVEDTPLETLFILYLRVFSSFRNVFHYGLIMVLIGKYAWNAYKKRCYNQRSLFYRCIIVYLLYLVELFALRDKSFVDDGSMFIVLPIFIVFFVLALLHYISDIDKYKSYRNLSTGIYLVHKDITILLTLVCMLFLDFDIGSLNKFIIVSILSFVICSLSYRLDWKIAKYLK